MIGWLRRLLFGPARVSVTPSAVHADHGGVAAGRDIRDSTIRVGIDEQEIERRIVAAQRPLVEQVTGLVDQVARAKGIPVEPLRAILARLGEVGVADDEIPRRLEFAAERLIHLRAKLTRSAKERPEFTATRQLVLGSIDRGDLEGARAVLQRARERARSLRLPVEEVESIAIEGRVNQLQLNYRAAAMKYAEAAHLVGTFDPEGVWGLLMHQADSLTAQGTEYGDNQALTDAIAIYKRCLTLAPRPKRPLDWASTQNALGVALSRVGERESASDRLKESVAAYREALKECTRERAPSDWASTKNNIGNVLTQLGDREDSVPVLVSAVTAYEEALQECTRERMPLEWANIQSNLGTTLQLIGKREAGTGHLERAVACYQAALAERTRSRVPLDWALTKNNLGNTLRLLSERERSVALLNDSIACFLDALQERRRERVPLDWAMTTSNLGMTLVCLGSVERNPSHVASGLDALHAAQVVFENVNADHYVRGNKENLVIAQLALSEVQRAAREEN
jgi:tetratricopeptide (TPR) repeat protein